MPDELSTLEQTILAAKGLTLEQIGALSGIGIHSRADFATVGDAATLAQVLPGVSSVVANDVMAWAVGAPAAGLGTTGAGARVVLDTSDAVYCDALPGEAAKGLLQRRPVSQLRQAGRTR